MSGEFLKIYELSKMLKANTDIILQEDNKLYGMWTKKKKKTIFVLKKLIDVFL